MSNNQKYFFVGCAKNVLQNGAGPSLACGTSENQKYFMVGCAINVLQIILSQVWPVAHLKIKNILL